MVKAKKATVTVDMRPHPTSAEHTRCIITTRKGYCWYADWAGMPTEQQVIDAWTEDKGRKDFLPYRGW